MLYKRIALGIVFIWFAVGGSGHFIAPDFFIKIIPPDLPWRMPAVYISGFFELAGALGLIFYRTRRMAGVGLLVLTIVVTPANVYMWRNAALFPMVSETLLAFRLILQIGLLACIWWGSSLTPRNKARSRSVK
ncbi:DoxX family protein [Glaciimonas immobilis]|uniref:Putative membrane protein n=1 Tax=Glaciimonas immobilis TaxID=728004 RepID=A0A840RW87_9BURK|nr:hypothetical protein [Glaciimonas immobilis]KAF3996314.1 hypothetical protein HAV38_19030 [Glaciimonas immobilis]MBB5202145.1 putative membrane protein [Glaciimonas immobilis]